MSFDYNPDTFPDPTKDSEGFSRKLAQELNAIQQAARGASNYIQFKPLTAEPSRKYEDMVVFADGDNWDPGDGPGLYAWAKLPATSDPLNWYKIGKQPTLASTRPQLSSNTTLYVNTGTGSDSNDGLTSGAAFKTIAKAITTAYAYDINGYTLTIQVADGTYDETVSFNHAFVGLGTVVLQGNLTTPTNVVVGSSSGHGILAQFGAYVTIQGMRVRSGGAGLNLIAQYGAVVQVQKLDFNTCGTGGYHLYATWESQIVVFGACTVSASAVGGVFIALLNSTVLVGASFTFSGTLTFAQTCYALYGGVVYLQSGITLSGGTLTITYKYIVSNGGILQTSSVSIPGTGTARDGGWVDGVFYLNQRATYLFSDVSANLTAGYTSTSIPGGTKSSGTFTPAYATGNIQDITNGGAFTLGVPTGHGTMVLDIVNNASAGAITTSSYTKVTGDAFATTNGLKYRCYISTGAQGSHLHVQAMQ